MPVRIANIELTGLQAIYTDEGLRAVKQEIPGGAGSVIQELGRSSAALALEGLMLGEEALDSLESLRQAQVKARPVSFAADIIAGVDFTDVLIDALNVHQVAGHRNRYWYRLNVREHVEEPESPGVELAGVSADVEAHAASWAGGAVGAARVIQDVISLPDLVETSSSIVDHLSVGDLAGALDNAAAELTGGQLDSIVSAIGLDPQTLEEVLAKLESVQKSDLVAAYEAIKDPSTIPDLPTLRPGILDKLGIGDLSSALVERADAISGGQLSQILQRIGQVSPAKVAGLLNDLRNTGGLGEFVEKLARGGVDLVEDLTGIDLGSAAALVKGAAGAVNFIRKAREVSEKITALASQLRSFDPLAAVRALAEGGDRSLAATAASTAGDILHSTGELIEVVDALLSTNTAAAVVSLARQVGCQEEINAAADLLLKGIGELDELLGGIKEPLLQLGALSGLLEITSSLVAGLKRIAKTSAEELAVLGLSGAQDAAGPFSVAMMFGRDFLDGGAAVIRSAPPVESIDGLRGELARLCTGIEGYKSHARGGAR